MKKLIITLAIIAFAMQARAYDFQSGNLLYTILSSNPPCVSLDGHVDGQAAQGELVIPETVNYEGVSYTVTEIGSTAFGQCTGLTGHLTIPNTISTIRAYAFVGCSGFTGDLVIPNSVTLLLGGAFWGCTGFDGHLSISNSVSKIYGSTFCECRGLNGTLVIPNSVTEIAVQAFASCTGFTGTLVIPNSVTKISEDYQYTYEGYGSFQNCTGFTGLELPETLPIIGDYCFAQCTSLTGELVIPEGVTKLWEHAFWLCSNLTGVRFPNTLTVIGYGAFKDCQGLTGTLEIPLSVTEIYGIAFSYCRNISAVTLHSGIQLKGDYVFAYCSSLTEIKIPEGWEKTNKNTFEGCSSLIAVTLPESLKTIETGCFKKCTNLSKINLDENLNSIGSRAFSHCFSLYGDLSIPNSVEIIYPYAFDSCYNIKNVMLGNSINHFAEESFRNIPLEKLVIKATTPPLMEHLTWLFPRDLSIVIPCGTLEAYQNAEGWSEFTNITEGVVFDFVALSEDEDAGIVNVLKEATCEDMTVEVEAMPVQGGTFLYWKANGEVVSSENPYSFTLDKDTRLVAVFSGTSIEETKQGFSLYPNPATNLVHIEGIEAADIQVYNTLGQLVRTVQSSNEISMEGLPQGIYPLRITTADGKVFSDKVVKKE